MAHHTKRKSETAVAAPAYQQSKKQKFSKPAKDGLKSKQQWDNKPERAPKRPPFAKEPEKDDDSDFGGFSEEEGDAKDVVDPDAMDVDSKPSANIGKLLSESESETAESSYTKQTL
jgi:hypothetical protein